MLTYKETAITAKKGINYIRRIIENNGSLFHKIEQENDLGIDAIIEFIDNGNPTNISIAVQIKTGRSYFNETKTKCFIPVEQHYNYWKNYSLPVIGIVVDPDNNTGNWIDIKHNLQNNENLSRIEINRNRTNIFDNTNYISIFLKFYTLQIPTINFENALSMFTSSDFEETELGLVCLFNNFKNRKQVWDEFIIFITSNEPYRIPNKLIYYLAHIPGHGDILYHGEPLNNEIKQYVKSQLSNLSVCTVIKLLELIDEDGIARGTIGQSIEAIFSIISKINEKLEVVISNTNLNNKVRFAAAAIYAYYKDTEAIIFLNKYTDINDINLIIQELNEFDGISLYN